jgi:UDP-N-acetylglucosamine acyltransferase
MNTIHPTAVIHEGAKLGTNNYIGPYCVIGPRVTLGSNNRLETHISIGTAAEHRDFFHLPPGEVVIGNGNIFREFVTINGGTKDKTIVGNNVVMLRGSHLGHDVIVGDKANLSCNVLVGGHTIIGEGANLGLGAAVHQFRTIGAYSMVGMNSTVTRNILPFVVAYGSPAETQKINQVGLVRSGVAKEQVQIFEEWFFKMNGLFENAPRIDHEYNKYIDHFKASTVKPSI